MSWGVLPSDVLDMTGASATAPQVAVADALVTIFINRTAEASASISPRDLHWIRSAICWETPWAAAQPDLLTRSHFTQLSQDGLSITQDALWAKMLAPMAARSIRNISWKGSRTVFTPPAELFGRLVDFTLETSDQYTGWHQL